MYNIFDFINQLGSVIGVVIVLLEYVTRTVTVPDSSLNI